MFSWIQRSAPHNGFIDLRNTFKLMCLEIQLIYLDKDVTVRELSMSSSRINFADLRFFVCFPCCIGDMECIQRLSSVTGGLYIDCSVDSGIMSGQRLSHY